MHFRAATKTGIFRAVLLTLSLSLAACNSTEETVLDAATADAAAVDATVECTEDAQCNDGLFCNGTESCSPGGQCLSGSIVDCNDGIACTIDQCSNETRACVSTAPDVDEDGHGDSSCLDTNGTPLGDDCNDLDGNRFPGNVEFCDAENHDEDCDSTTFGIVDVDSDGHPSAECCNLDEEASPAAFLCGTDCDDTKSNINPGVTEACDGLDNNCNGDVDEGVSIPGFVDKDGDGFGDSAQPISQCGGSAQFSAQGNDCDDENPAINPGQAELCDGIDNNCNGDIDDSTQIVSWFVDSDSDLYGDPNLPAIESCTPIAGRSVLNTDCDDTVAGINPGSPELCDGLDNDCNGLADFRIGVNDFEDDDGDGIIDIACAPLGVDCDDNNPVTGPGTIEQCDGQDNDCDGVVDENVAQSLFFRDIDSDGFGSSTSGTLVSCEQPLGFSAAGNDCEDNDPNRFPGADEICNGTDDDCDSAVDEGEAITSCPAASNASPACVAGGCELQCNTDFADCNTQDSDGCEVQTSSDPNHCGSCNATCNFPNQTSSCSNGQCDCLPGFSDCDGNPANGCETNLNEDTDDCGSCGNSCSFQNGFEQCTAGVCNIRFCVPGFDNCDGAISTGCETAVNTDTQCGSCDNDCTALANVTGATCEEDGDGGRCFFPETACDSGFLDCSNNFEDGCETPNNTNVSCGSNCQNITNCSTAPNSSGSCVNSNCECTADFASCEQNSVCETNTQTDRDHCGDCSTFCSGGQECIDGQCATECIDPNTGFCDGDTTVCVRLDTNENCGSCGNACPTEATNGFSGCFDTGGIFNCDSGCFAGFEDCDADPTDCETNIITLADCGGCGVPCETADGEASCDNFGTGILCTHNCTPGSGFQNCDGDETTCESNSQTDPNNCGSCGNSCGFGGECNFGSCDSIQALTAGENFTCALRTSGVVVCWGDNGAGQLGNDGLGTNSFTPVPVLDSAIAEVSILASGAKHSCAIGATATFCWGDNTFGQLGSDGADSGIPLLVAGGHPFIDIAVGRSHSCGIDSFQDVYCWGDNTRGQLGQGTTGPGGSIPVAIPLGQIPGGAFRIFAGEDYTCATSMTSDLFCWGAGTDGQLGRGTTIDAATPAIVSNVFGVNTASAGTTHACAIISGTDQMRCWGANASRQIGNDTANPIESDPVLLTLAGVKDVTTGAAHTCSTNSSQSLFCWGKNTEGQAGQGVTSASVNFPDLVSLTDEVLLLSKGTSAEHVCVVTSDFQAQQKVLCWGSNSAGQLGSDPAVNALLTTPTEVVGF